MVTDHKPLLGLIAGDRQTSQILSPRMTHWTVFLKAYNYHLIHRPGKWLSHTDTLSQWPLPLVEDLAPTSLVLIETLPSSPIMAAEITKHSNKDQILAQVLNRVRRGWPKKPVGKEFRPFYTRQHELSAQRGCLLCGHWECMSASILFKNVNKTIWGRI